MGECRLINPHHSDRFDFDEDTMLVGVQSFVNAVELYWGK